MKTLLILTLLLSVHSIFASLVGCKTSILLTPLHPTQTESVLLADSIEILATSKEHTLYEGIVSVPSGDQKVYIYTENELNSCTNVEFLFVSNLEKTISLVKKLMVEVEGSAIDKNSIQNAKDKLLEVASEECTPLAPLHQGEIFTKDIGYLTIASGDFICVAN